jgi:hypothetical protein
MLTQHCRPYGAIFFVGYIDGWSIIASASLEISPPLFLAFSSPCFLDFAPRHALLHPSATICVSRIRLSRRAPVPDTRPAAASCAGPSTLPPQNVKGTSFPPSPPHPPPPPLSPLDRSCLPKSTFDRRCQLLHPPRRARFRPNYPIISTTVVPT